MQTPARLIFCIYGLYLGPKTHVQSDGHAFCNAGHAGFADGPSMAFIIDPTRSIPCTDQFAQTGVKVIACRSDIGRAMVEPPITGTARCNPSTETASFVTPLQLRCAAASVAHYCYAFYIQVVGKVRISSSDLFR
jgi:hypothetical protein